MVSGRNEVLTIPAGRVTYAYRREHASGACLSADALVCPINARGILSAIPYATAMECDRRGRQPARASPIERQHAAAASARVKTVGSVRGYIRASLISSYSDLCSKKKQAAFGSAPNAGEFWRYFNALWF